MRNYRWRVLFCVNHSEVGETSNQQKAREGVTMKDSEFLMHAKS
jgi:hypothetical protein